MRHMRNRRGREGDPSRLESLSLDIVHFFKAIMGNFPDPAITCWYVGSGERGPGGTRGTRGAIEQTINITLHSCWWPTAGIDNS